MKAVNTIPKTTSTKNFKRPAISQHKDMLLDKRYHHKTEASRKARVNGQVERLFQLEMKGYLSGQY